MSYYKLQIQSCMEFFFPLALYLENFILTEESNEKNKVIKILTRALMKTNWDLQFSRSSPLIN